MLELGVSSLLSSALVHPFQRGPEAGEVESQESWKEKNKLETQSRQAWLLALEERAMENSHQVVIVQL